MMTDRRPYDEIEDEDEVVRLFGEIKFPSATHIPLGSVIRKCWSNRFETTAEVLDDVLNKEASEVETNIRPCIYDEKEAGGAQRLSASMGVHTKDMDAGLQTATKTHLH